MPFVGAGAALGMLLGVLFASIAVGDTADGRRGVSVDVIGGDPDVTGMSAGRRCGVHAARRRRQGWTRRQLRRARACQPRSRPVLARRPASTPLSRGCARRASRAWRGPTRGPGRFRCSRQVWAERRSFASMPASSFTRCPRGYLVRFCGATETDRRRLHARCSRGSAARPTRGPRRASR